MPSIHPLQPFYTSKKFKIPKINIEIPIKRYPDFLRGNFSIKREQIGYEMA